jgi:hypothetical protein
MKFQQIATATAQGAADGGVAMDKDKAEVVRRGVMLRSRKPTETCLLPNKLLHRLQAGSDGALACKFNNSGSLIAVACCNKDFEFPVRIYDSESGSLRHEFLGHHSIVYVRRARERSEREPGGRVRRVQALRARGSPDNRIACPPLSP